MGPDHVDAPGRPALRLTRRVKNLCQLRAEGLGQQGQALAGERLIDENELDDVRFQPRQRVCAGVHQSISVYARQQVLRALAPNE